MYDNCPWHCWSDLRIQILFCVFRRTNLFGNISSFLSLLPPPRFNHHRHALVAAELLLRQACTYLVHTMITASVTAVSMAYPLRFRRWHQLKTSGATPPPRTSSSVISAPFARLEASSTAVGHHEAASR